VGDAPVQTVRPPHGRRPAKRRITPQGNPTQPGLDRCGISAAVVCPERAPARP
jgi:hypothetical protein